MARELVRRLVDHRDRRRPRRGVDLPPFEPAQAVPGVNWEDEEEGDPETLDVDLEPATVEEFPQTG